VWPYHFTNSLGSKGQKSDVLSLLRNISGEEIRMAAPHRVPVLVVPDDLIRLIGSLPLQKGHQNQTGSHRHRACTVLYRIHTIAVDFLFQFSLALVFSGGDVRTLQIFNGADANLLDEFEGVAGETELLKK
jgi:hypothetical protein